MTTVTEFRIATLERRLKAARARLEEIAELPKRHRGINPQTAAVLPGIGEMLTEAAHRGLEEAADEGE